MTFLKKMTPLAHTISLLVALSLAYVWLELPMLRPFALQAFAGSVLCYFGLKWLHGRQIWHLAPHTHSGEMAVATFAFMMLIGATGNLDSLFYPLAYVHLLFLVFATVTGTSLATMIGVMVFHYALGIDLTMATMADLMTLPLIYVFFLFAKHQYQQIVMQQEQLKTEKEILEQEESDVISFFEQVLKPQLMQLRNLLAAVPHSPDAETNLDQIEASINQLEQRIRSYQSQAMLAAATEDDAAPSTDQPAE